MSNNPFGHDGSNPQNNPYGGDYDQSANGSGSYDHGNYGNGDYSQGDYGNHYSQADFGSNYGQDAPQPVGSQGGYADYQQPVGSQGGYADYQQDPQAYGGGDLYGAGGPGGPVGPGGPSSTEKNSLGVIALVSGIVGFFIWLAGIVAIITGFMSLKAVKNGQANNKGVGLTGLILGIFTTVVGLIVTVIVVIVFVIGIGVAGKDPGPADPGGGTEAPADPQDDGINAGSDKAELIGTYEGIEIRAYVTHGKTDEITVPEEFAERDVLVIKYFLKNTSDQSAQLGYTSVKCAAGGKDCSKSVHGRIGDKRLDSAVLSLGANPIGAGEEEEFVTAQSVEYKDAGDAEISLLVSDRDFKDEKEFKIK
ncbi:MAG TPA: DUF4190 domain-containing protein [Brevibacterium ravenspurgense]|nr:DUF4190 domain-containing protein [Brevibacterium ravenspurgense]